MLWVCQLWIACLTRYHLHVMTQDCASNLMSNDSEIGPVKMKKA